MRRDRESREPCDLHDVAANDNPGSGSGAEARIDAAVMTLARLLGRRIAREEFDRLDAANDNAPASEAGER